MTNTTDYTTQQDEKQRTLLKKNMMFIANHTAIPEELNKHLINHLAYLENKAKGKALNAYNQRYVDRPYSRRYGPIVKVKAFIRYNSTDRKQVVYFRKGMRMFKLLDGNNVQLMTTRVTLNHWLRNVSRDIKTTPVFYGEQVLYNGKPVKISMDTEEVLESLLDTLV